MAKKHKLYKDEELGKLMAKIRGLLGQDVLITFKTTETASRLIATYDNPINDYDDDTPSPPAANTPEIERDLKRRYSKIRARDKSLDYVG